MNNRSSKTNQILRIFERLTIVCVLGFSSFASAGLVHLWEANGNTDDSVGGVTGALIGDAGYDSGFDGQAFSFSGQGQLFKALVDIGPNNFEAVTFGAWVKIGSERNNLGWAIGHDNGGFDRSISLHDNRYGGKPAAGTGAVYTSTLPELDLNVWTFVAASYQGNSKVTTVYSAGSAQQVSSTNNSAGRDAFTVGGLEQFAGHEISGLVDNVFIYDRALSVDELRNIEKSGRVPAPATLALMGLGLVGLSFFRRRKA